MSTPPQRPAAEPAAEHGGIVLPVVLGLAALATAYVGVAWSMSDSIPTHTTIGGVAVGGLGHDRAAARLTEAATLAAEKPITVTAGTTSFRVTPAEAGFGVDVEHSLRGLTGFNLSPTSVVSHLRGSVERPMTVTRNQAALTAAVERGAKEVAVTVREGSLAFSGATVTYRPPVAGQAVDVARTADLVSAAWPAKDTVNAVVTTTAPQVPVAEFDREKTEFADKVVAGPVHVTAGAARFDVAPQALTPAVTFTVKGTTVTHSIDEKKVVAAVRKVAKDKGVEKPAADAKVTWVDGGPKVTPSVTGVALDDATLAKTVVAALTSPLRAATVPTKVTEPQLTTAKARATLPKGLISTFTTYFPNNPVRTHNLQVAANRLNGTYVAPGQTFSLNAHLGQRTAASGYNKAQVIYNGRLAYDYGGGISQVSTTLFNAIFFSGAKIEEYHPHSFYISRYPIGREATISWPDVDNRFTNDTSGGILIRSWLSGNAITVQFYGTKTWDIESVTGPRRNIVKPRTIRDDKAGCVPQAPSEGFDITVSRVFKKNGATVKTSTFHTHYIPEDEVICSRPYTP